MMALTAVEVVPIEAHAINRIRHFQASNLQRIIEALVYLSRDGFTGDARVSMTEGGFNGVVAEESVALVPRDT